MELSQFESYVDSSGDFPWLLVPVAGRAEDSSEQTADLKRSHTLC